MMKRIVPIIDFPHGSNVLGKCSPDKVYKEWIGGRKVGNDIAMLLKAYGYKVYFSNPLDTEGGLTNRVKFAENLKVEPGQYKFLLSFHNNAAGDGSKWMQARGFEIWTKEGIDLADVLADIAFPVMKRWFPNIRLRMATDKDFARDKEGNLAVLKGKGVYSVLFEYGFMDNKEDAAMLLDERQNKRYADAIVDMIENMEEYLSKNL